MRDRHKTITPHKPETPCIFNSKNTGSFHLQWASRAPGLCLRPAAHARGWFRVRAHTGLLFSRAGRKPAPAPSTPAVGKSRTVSISSPRLARTRGCAGQVALRVSFLPVSRTHARLRRASRAPCLFLPRVSHARAAAPGKSRTVSLSSPCLARTRLVPGAGPHRASVFPGGEKAHLLFPAAGRKPAVRKPVPNFHEYVKRGATRSPTHRNARKAELCSLAFQTFPLSAGGLRPEGPLSRPAARKRRRAASGRRRPPSHRNA